MEEKTVKEDLDEMLKGAEADLKRAGDAVQVLMDVEELSPELADQYQKARDSITKLREAQKRLK